MSTGIDRLQYQLLLTATYVVMAGLGPAISCVRQVQQNGRRMDAVMFLSSAERRFSVLA
jgi:hypothetical protein